ncbi:hypothetical protein LguiB_021120 [Lonicera macranthoides]
MAKVRGRHHILRVPHLRALFSFNHQIFLFVPPTISPLPPPPPPNSPIHQIGLRRPFHPSFACGSTKLDSIALIIHLCVPKHQIGLHLPFYLSFECQSTKSGFITPFIHCLSAKAPNRAPSLNSTIVCMLKRRTGLPRPTYSLVTGQTPQLGSIALISNIFYFHINHQVGTYELSAQPLILSRCKSEPVRTEERLNPAIASRLLVIALIILWRNLLSPYDTSASLNPNSCISSSSSNNGSNSHGINILFPRSASAIEESIAWDGVYFVLIVQCGGYEYEQSFAFFVSHRIARGISCESIEGVSILMCTERQYPPSEVAQILDSAVRRLQPSCPQNLGVYTEIQMSMGRIKTQILALIKSTVKMIFNIGSKLKKKLDIWVVCACERLLVDFKMTLSWQRSPEDNYSRSSGVFSHDKHILHEIKTYKSLQLKKTSV